MYKSFIYLFDIYLVIEHYLRTLHDLKNKTFNKLITRLYTSY